MTGFVALLRAINVGGAVKLPMSELKALCEDAGFEAVRTYIASGNVVFRSDKSEPQVKALLDAKLQAYAGKPLGVMVRTAEEMAKVLADNPFATEPPSATVAIFLDAHPHADALNTITHQAPDEHVALGVREIYVAYGHGIGTSKLKIPAAKAGTARNMNTVAKLAAMAAELA